MDDIVAIKVKDSKAQTHYFLTWGRIFDRVDPKELETVMAKHLALRLPAGYRIVRMPRFNGSFRSLVNWATEQRLVPGPEVARRHGQAAELVCTSEGVQLDLEPGDGGHDPSEHD